MKIITSMFIQNFKNYLREEEKSKSTIEKYIRDITALMVWLGGRVTDKTAVLEYKEIIRTEYAARSVKSIIVVNDDGIEIHLKCGAVITKEYVK